MGRRDRERVARILAGAEPSIAQKVKSFAVSAGAKVVQAYSHDNKVRFLADALHSGKLSHATLKRELEANAPKEMRKGAEKLHKRGEPVTVEALLKEYREDTLFQQVAAEAGLPEQYFSGLAQEESSRWNNGGH